MTRAAAVVLLALALAPALARADEPAAPAEPDPDPAAIEAGDANLESIAPRKGIVFTFAFGGAVSVGLGMDNATGQGGSATLRLAHVANRRSTVAVELAGSALLAGVSGELYRTDVTHLLIAAQYYLNPALWFRAGVGWGRYAGNELRMGDFIVRERFRFAGPAGSVGGGVDILRLKRFRASVEFASTALLNRDGILSSNSFLLGLAFD